MLHTLVEGEEVDECLLLLLVVGQVPAIPSRRTGVNLLYEIKLRLGEHELVLLVWVLVHDEKLL